MFKKFVDKSTEPDYNLMDDGLDQPGDDKASDKQKMNYYRSKLVSYKMMSMKSKLDN